MPKVKVTQTGYVAGQLHKEGEVLELTDRQTACGLRRGRIQVLEGGDKDTEKEELKAKLTELGVEFRANASVDTLKKLLAEAEANDPTA